MNTTQQLARFGGRTAAGGSPPRDALHTVLGHRAYHNQHLGPDPVRWTVKGGFGLWFRFDDASKRSSDSSASGSTPSGSWPVTRGT